MGADTVLTGFLKDVYLPGVTDTIYFDNAFTRQIASKTGTLDATGRRLIHAFDLQRSGGVGPIAEGGTFRDSVPVYGAQGHEFLKYSNLYFELSGPAIATCKQGEGSYVDIVSKHLNTIVKSEKMNVERLLMGSGDGRIGKVNTSATDSTSDVIYIDGPAHFDTQFIEKGMWIECVSATNKITTTYDGTNTAMSVSTFTRGDKTAPTVGTIYVTQDIDGSSTITSADWVCRKNAYSNTTSGLCLEQNGLMNLISDGSSTTTNYLGTESASNFTHIWNIDRTAAGNDYLQSQITNLSGTTSTADLDEDSLLDILITNRYEIQANPNMLIVTPRALKRYFSSAETGYQRFTGLGPIEWVGGYTGMGIQLEGRKYMLTTLASVPTNMGFLINTNDFAFMRPPGMSGYRWVSNDNGGVLKQKEASDNKFASAVDYWQFVCLDPGKQCKIYNIREWV
jgi:hypothetical protein